MSKKPMRAALSGHFTFIKIKEDGSEEIVAAFDNLILDQGLNHLGSSSSSALLYCRVGSGSTAPVVGQSALSAQLGSSSNVQATTEGFDSVGNAYTYARQRYRFDPGVATGNIAEVGVGWESTGSTLFSRALVLDVEGDPTTIVKLSDETLDIVYEVRFYLPEDNEFTFSIGEDDFDATARPALINSSVHWSLINFLNNGIGPGSYNYVYDGAMGASVLLGPSGTSDTLSIETVGSYSNNSLERNFRVAAGLDSANQEHQTYLLSTSLGSFQVEIDPPFTKNDTQVFSLDFTVSWARRA